MTENMKAADLIGKTIVVGDNQATIVIKSVDGDKLSGEFTKDGKTTPMSFPVSQLHGMTEKGLWKLQTSDVSPQTSEVTTEADVAEVSDIVPVVTKKPTAEVDEGTTDEKPMAIVKPMETKPKAEPKPIAKAEPAQQVPATKPRTATKPTTNNAPVGAPVFKIQIFISEKVLDPSDSRLKGEEPNYYKEGRVYKYTLGASTDYEEIVQLRKDIAGKFPGCFIVAFKNGEKVPNINDAIIEYKLNKRR